jgi:hypothetical protein
VSVWIVASGTFYNHVKVPDVGWRGRYSYGRFFNLVEFVNYRALVFVLRGFGHKVYVFALNSFCFALIVSI